MLVTKKIKNAFKKIKIIFEIHNIKINLSKYININHFCNNLEKMYIFYLLDNIQYYFITTLKLVFF